MTVDVPGQCVSPCCNINLETRGGLHAPFQTMDRLSQSPELNLIKIRAARADKNLSSAYIYTYIYIHNYSHTPPRRNRRKGNASRGGNAAVCPITYPTVITAKRINPQLPFRYPSKREGAFFRVFELIEPMGGGRSSRRIRERRKEPNIGRKRERERVREGEPCPELSAID